MTESLSELFPFRYGSLIQKTRTAPELIHPFLEGLGENIKDLAGREVEVGDRSP
jgi:hypothetical protein